MSSLNNKQVLLGVTGGIAAYKSADLVRRLQDAGATVRVVMTTAAQAFITPLTMQALSGQEVHTDLLDTKAEAAMGHIELARWADLILVAPATADFIAKLAGGEASDLLSTLCLASTSPIAIAPAMNQAMWAKPSVEENLTLLKRRTVAVIGPGTGSQACGDIGLGRMLEVNEIIAAAQQMFESGCMSGKKVVITAGPTREAIDPVRYLTNHSSGKMGYALAEAAVNAGADVTLISGPVNLPTPKGLTLIATESAQQMLDTAILNARGADIFIGAAAVADYRPTTVAKDKIKKTSAQNMRLDMEKTKDIVATIAASDKPPMTIGFAAETCDLLQHAREKLQRKKLDMIIANDVSDSRIGFNSPENAVTVLTADGSSVEFAQQSKTQLAVKLIKLVAEHAR